VASPNINTFREVVPYIYSWKTPDIPKYDGWEKIGYTEQDSSETRIAQQASQLSVEKVQVWSYRATFITEDGGRFTDTDFHAFLKQQGVEREAPPNYKKRTEWHHFAIALRTSRGYILDFISKNFATPQLVAEEDYTLRPEQESAVAQAITAFGAGDGEVLWNAKPRFGKTLTAYDLMQKMDVRRALIVTNRPAIANSWYDDFQRFIGHRTTYHFVSESPSLSERSPMTREQWRAFSKEHLDEDPRIIEFVSLQDLKGSQYFGGSYPKLKHIAEMDWDLLVIDEAHEGVDTTKTDIAFDQIKRSHTLHLSGTPFKALASGRFGENQIFNWTYEDEQTTREQWSDGSQDNPYASLPTLNLLTYQLSRMVADRLAEGVAIDEDEENVDYTFDLAEFFRTKDDGFFEYEPEVIKFLDTLTTNEKYPFSTPELRDEIRHSFWLLNRVSSAKALERLLKKHEVFKDYTIVLAAGDGRSTSDESLDEASDDAAAAGKSLEKVREAIRKAEAAGGKTITLSVGQLTTGVTVPEWTAVIMLSNISSPALYMQAAFRAQNSHTFVLGDNTVLQKKNAYIFDFAPERTLTIFDAFANNLSPNFTGGPTVRMDNIRRLLNFFPVLGEDSEGRMIELDASQVLTFPQVFKAREVVRRGFLSNLLFANVAGIFRYSEHVKQILDKLPTAKQGKVTTGQNLEMPVPPPETDADGNVKVDVETVINPKVAELGKPIWSSDAIPAVDTNTPAREAAMKIAQAVTEHTREKRKELAEEYGLTAKQVERDTKATEAEVQSKVERAYVEHKIVQQHLEDEAKEAATEVDAQAVETKRSEAEAAFQKNILDVLEETRNQIVPDVVTREETKKVQKQADKTMDDARSHLRGFARTIPMFLMAYGDQNTRLANFDDYTPDDVFEEIAGISEEEFRILRDGQEAVEEDGNVIKIPGLFDEAVFDQAIQQFLDKKAELADYFDDAQTEDIFAYIPQQKTSLVFTPTSVVTKMVDILEAENPGIFTDSTKTFADLFSTAGLFLMEIVRRLDTGLAGVIPDQDERLRHILTSQVYEMSHNKVLHRITIEAVSGGVPERKKWIEDSGHFRVGNLAHMTPEEREQAVTEMLGELT
jgi:superfamily II DNA or RNA helicase